MIPKMRVRRTQAPTRRNWTPPGPSRLRETVRAQEDERLSKVHRGFERFKVTGKQPPVAVPTSRSPQIPQYCPTASSTYRPFSMPPNTTDLMRRDGGQGSSSATPPRRLGSTDLFPDRYRQESRPVRAPTKARDSIVEDPKPATRDLAPSEDSPNPPHPPPRSRRSAAKSDGSDLSSTSSTESSRARKALAYSLDKDKAAWSPNASKSSPSVSFAGFRNAVRSIANRVLPAVSNSEAEHVTKELSRDPKASGARDDHDSLPYTEQAVENARPVSSNRRRSRKISAAASPLELDTSIEGLGILPSPEEPSGPVSDNEGHVVSGSTSQKQGPIESEFHVLIS